VQEASDLLGDGSMVDYVKLDICREPGLVKGLTHLLNEGAPRCATLQHTATHCNTLQHTATHCNTLQHTATQTMAMQLSATHFAGDLD